MGKAFVSTKTAINKPTEFDESAVLKLKSVLEKYQQNQAIRDKLRQIHLHMKKLLKKKIKGAPANKCERAQQLSRKTRWI